MTSFASCYPFISISIHSPLCDDSNARSPHQHFATTCLAPSVRALEQSGDGVQMHWQFIERIELVALRSLHNLQQPWVFCMVDSVLALFRAALYNFLYAILLAVVRLRTSYLSCKQRTKEWLHGVASQHPVLGHLIQWALQDLNKSHVGANPSRPTKLAVVVAQPLQDGALNQLAMVVSWAEQEGFRQVFLYDPQGWLQKRRLLLEKQLEGVGCPLVLHVGWPPAPGAAAADKADPLAMAAVVAAAEVRRRRRVGGQGASSGSEEEGRESHAQEGQYPMLEVVLLSAVDAHWPLAKAAAAAAMRGECTPGPAILASGGGGGGAVGPHVLTSAAAAAAATAEGVGVAGGEVEGSAESRLAQAVASPARLKARLQAVAGPMAGSEPDLVLVFGEALTLAGYPPWVVRVSEIFSAGMLEQLRSVDLSCLLRRYMGTKQRFGT